MLRDIRTARVRTERRNGVLFASDDATNWIPVPQGGGGDDGDDGGDDDGGDDDGDDTDDEDGDDGEGDDDEGKLGAKGKKALERERAAAKQARKDKNAALARATRAEQELAALKAGGDSDEAKIEQARREAAEEADAKWAEKFIATKVQAIAAGMMTAKAAARAPRLLDLDQFELDDNGEIDEDEVIAAIDELLEEMPELKSKGGSSDGGGKGGTTKKRPTGSADQGARGTRKAPKEERVKARLEGVKKRTGIK